MIIINSDKCIGCFQCVSVCPFHVIHAADGKAEVREDGLCIKCLHCASVCPQNAVDLDCLQGVLPGEMPEFPENFHKLLENYLMTRRSYRSFKPEPVPKDMIENALRISAWAPSAKNQHPTKWIVISDSGVIKLIMVHSLKYIKETGISPEVAVLYDQGKNVVTGNAKTLILGYSRTNAINPSVDTALALYSAELALQSQGLGTCWAGYLTRMCNQVPSIRDLLRLPEDCQVYGAIMVGFPENEKYIHIPNRHKQADIRWMQEVHTFGSSSI